MERAMLWLDDGSFRYRTDAPYIFEHISFSIKGGEVLALLGRNGVGKSTLLACLMGFQELTQGRIYTNGQNIYAMSPRERAREIAFVPQIISAESSFTVRDYVSFGATVRTGMFSAPSKADYAQTDAILEELGIAHIRDRQCRELSGGQRQLVAIGRALLQNTRLILMDEPTAALDVRNQVLVLQTIDSLRAKGYGVVFTTHLPEQALLLNSRVALCFGTHMDFYESVDEVRASHLEELYGTKLSLFHSDNVGRTVCVIPRL